MKLKIPQAARCRSLTGWLTTGLAAAASFSVLAGSEVTSTGPSLLSQDLGVSPGTAISGFPPGQVLGAVHAADQVANDARSDLVTTYNNAASQATDFALAAGIGAGQTLLPGVHTASSLGQSENRLRADEPHLAVDVDPAAPEFDVLDGASEDLLLTQTAPEGELAACLEALGQPGDDTAVTEDRSAPAWLAEATTTAWQMPMPNGPLRDTLLVRERSTYGYAKASWEINLGCDHDCGFCYLGEKRFEGLDWDDKTRLLTML